MAPVFNVSINPNRDARCLRAARERLPLCTLLDRLPQELFDQIKTAVFDYDTHEDVGSINASVTVENTYTPPSFLQVNSQTRLIASREFYGNTRFVFLDLDIFSKWLISLPVIHTRTLRDVRFLAAEQHLPEGELDESKVAVPTDVDESENTPECLQGPSHADSSMAFIKTYRGEELRIFILSTVIQACEQTPKLYIRFISQLF